MFLISWIGIALILAWGQSYWFKAVLTFGQSHNALAHNTCDWPKVKTALGLYNWPQANIKAIPIQLNNNAFINQPCRETKKTL